MIDVAKRLPDLSQLCLVTELRKLSAGMGALRRELTGERPRRRRRRAVRVLANRVAMNAGAWTRVVAGDGARIAVVLSTNAAANVSWSQPPFLAGALTQGFQTSPQNPMLVLHEDQWDPIQTYEWWAFIAAAGLFAQFYTVSHL